jgi:hypothetical protein
MVDRAVRRDPAWTDPAIDIRQRYETFWAACDSLYRERHDPVALAHCIIDNNDLDHPKLLRFSSSLP